MDHQTREPTALLNTSTVASYVKGHLRGIEDLPLDLDAELSVVEITDGNLNYAFHVHEAGSPAHAVFVKQAPCFIKCLGPDFELSAHRAVFESDVLCEFQRLAPLHVPRHLLLDEARCVLVLQFMHGHTLLRTALQAGSCSARVAGDLGRFMGEIHRQTHAALLSETECAALDARFRNTDMCAITADYVFTKPLDQDDPTNHCSEALMPHASAVRQQPGVREHVMALRSHFETSRQCLVHGDLHTGSVLVPEAPLSSGADGPAVVIDAEFAFYGPAAFDVGILMANLLFAALRHAPHPELQAPMLEMVAECWRAYLIVLARPAAVGGAPSPLGEAGAVRALLREAAGYCGCELLRRVLGAAHVTDLETIAAAHDKLRAERAALELGRALLTGRDELEEVGQLLEICRIHATTPWEGRFSDPRHSGLMHTVSWLGGLEYQIEGVDGDAQPWKVVGTRTDSDTLVVDFSPREGPADLVAKMQPGGDIAFPDGNVWKKH